MHLENITTVRQSNIAKHKSYKYAFQNHFLFSKLKPHAYLFYAYLKWPLFVKSSPKPSQIHISKSIVISRPEPLNLNQCLKNHNYNSHIQHKNLSCYSGHKPPTNPQVAIQGSNFETHCIATDKPPYAEVPLSRVHTPRILYKSTLGQYRVRPLDVLGAQAT